MKNNTVHICHWHEIKAIAAYADLVFDNDVVVFFGDIDSASAIEIKTILFPKTTKVFYVKTEQNDHNILKQISHLKWIDIISQSHRTLTWK